MHKMELNIQEETKTKLVAEIKGEDATLCNLLVKELTNDKEVKHASYAVEHPSIGVPTLLVETTSKKAPRKALLDAVQRLKKLNETFKKAFEKEFK